MKNLNICCGGDGFYFFEPAKHYEYPRIVQCTKCEKYWLMLSEKDKQKFNKNENHIIGKTGSVFVELLKVHKS